MLRPSQLADPRFFQNETVEYEVKWSADGTVATLALIVNGTRHRMKLSAVELDLLREFLNANVE